MWKLLSFVFFAVPIYGLIVYGGYRALGVWGATGLAVILAVVIAEEREVWKKRRR